MSSTGTEFKFWYALSLGLQLGFMIAVPIGGFILLGYWVDNHFLTHPVFILLGIVLGFSITAYEVYQWLLPLIKEDK